VVVPRRRKHDRHALSQRGASSTARAFADSAALDALGRLGERHQQVLTLRYLADLSTAEAAEAMQVGRSHFAVLQYRALGALRQQWEGSRDV
jgi:RNA polymerase sigma factor (sigma-70 family)